jgi:hypothetical protein
MSGEGRSAEVHDIPTDFSGFVESYIKPYMNPDGSRKSSGFVTEIIGTHFPEQTISIKRSNFSPPCSDVHREGTREIIRLKYLSNRNVFQTDISSINPKCRVTVDADGSYHIDESEWGDYLIIPGFILPQDLAERFTSPNQLFVEKSVTDNGSEKSSFTTRQEAVDFFVSEIMSQIGLDRKFTKYGWRGSSMGNEDGNIDYINLRRDLDETEVMEEITWTRGYKMAYPFYINILCEGKRVQTILHVDERGKFITTTVCINNKSIDISCPFNYEITEGVLLSLGGSYSAEQMTDMVLSNRILFSVDDSEDLGID